MTTNTPPPLAAWAAMTLPLLAVVAACFLGIGGEDAVADYFTAWRAGHPQAAALLKLYTNWGNPALYLVFAGILLRGLMLRRADLTAWALAYLAAQLLVSLALERVLKIGLGRPRPGVGGPWLPLSFDSPHNSLPSGHTTEMTLQCASLGLYARTLAVPCLLGLALGLMAASRLALGWHHPTDILGGLALGSLGGIITHRLRPIFEPRLARLMLKGGR